MISKEEVKHIAALARIGLAEDEIEKFSHDLSSILDWIKELEKADISNIEPTAHITGIKNRDREDKTEKFSERDEIIGLFPEEKGGYDKVKSVL